MDKTSIANSPPSDILQQIFELAIEDCEVPRIVSIGTTTPHDKLIRAIELSSISRAWRAIALETHRLWNTVSISLDWDTRLIEEYWANTMARVGGIPVSLLIYDICEGSRVKLDSLDVSKMRLGTVELHFKHPGDAVLFPPLWREYGIDSLNIAIYRQYHGRMGPHASNEPLELQHFCGKANTLELRPWDPTPATLAPIVSAPLRHLVIRKIQDLDMGSVFRSFPQLESVELVTCSFNPISSIAPATKLQVLKFINNGENNWLGRMEFPKLRELSLDDNFPSDLAAFLRNNSTIETLSFRHSYSQELQTVASSASQVKNLRMTLGGTAPWAELFADVGTFPALEKFGIIDGYDNIREGELDTLIKARCLPLHHPESTATSLERVVKEFFVEIGRSDSCDKSELYREASKRIVNEGYRQRIYLSWSEPGEL